jgi:hypothetical protein
VRELTYLDFDVLLERIGEGTYRARVLRAPTGEPAPVAFALPFTQLELDNFLLRIGRPRRSATRRIDRPETAAIKSFGGQLFAALFQDELRDSLLRSIREAAGQGAGLRIRLRLSDCPELAELPWEFLYDQRRNRFLALSRHTPLVRYLELPDPSRPLTVSPPLRVLVMISSPSDYPTLDVEQEWAKLQQALGGLEAAGRVAVERLEAATLSALQQRLRRTEFHIFHFIGHGGFDPQREDGVLVGEDRAGRGWEVSGEELGSLLNDHDPMRLAVLNACEGARSDPTDPFAGTAQSLIQQGLSAVVAMQFEITDQAAIILAHELYGAVADGYPLDGALAEARKAIRNDGNLVEWATPVLYLRAPDARIFDLAAAPAGRTPTTIRPPIKDAERDQLAERYTDGLAAFYNERWDEAVEAFGAIVARDADYEDAAVKLEEAGRQRQLAHHYAEASSASEQGDWALAVEHLEAIMSAGPGYRDAQQRLEEARRTRQLANLWAEAQQLSQARQWEAVLRVGEHLAALDPGNADHEALMSSARAEHAAAERARVLAERYGQALRHINGGAWSEAHAALEEIHKVDSDYRDAPALLAIVRQNLVTESDSEQDKGNGKASADHAPSATIPETTETDIIGTPGLESRADKPNGTAQAKQSEELERNIRSATIVGLIAIVILLVIGTVVLIATRSSRSGSGVLDSFAGPSRIFSASSPWRLQVNGDSCWVKLFTRDDTEIGDFYSLSSQGGQLQVRSTGEFYYRTYNTDTDCSAKPLSGMGSATLPFTLAVPGDTNAIQSPSQLLISAKPKDSSFACSISLHDARDGRTIDSNYSSQQGQTLEWRVTPQAPTVYVKGYYGCITRISKSG